MGNFFTSIQIHNPEQLGKEQFIELFCNKMKENGFVVGNEDDHEISYALAFANNCKWVSVGSEVYEQGNATVQKDARNIAKMLNTCCINVTVVDSDFAMLDMYSNTGKKLDTVVMGRADDYLGDDIPAPKKNAWSAILSENSTWERFTAVQQGDYIFVEDGLSELAPLINMDSRNILFEAADANESDENTCFLYFKKASTKKTKQLTLNAAFKQIFGEALEPLGFVKIKSKHPYFVRVVNGEILHIITYRTEQPSYPEDKAFNVLGGVATVYRRKIDLSVGIKNNYNWLRSSVGDFYAIPLGEDYDRYYRQTISRFYYFSEIEKSMLSALNDSLELVKKYMLPVLNCVDTLEKSIEFFKKFTLPIDTNAYNTDLCFDGDSDYNEGFLYIKADYQKLKEKWRRIVEGENKILPETLKIVNELYKFFVDPVFNKAVLDELERRKKTNTEILTSYGLFSEKANTKKPKKLTLNAAFKQVFGEALEPLGFKKVKSKYPYFVRVVNGEILHIITFDKDYPGKFSVFGGIATVYRKKIDFDQDVLYNLVTLNDTAQFYAYSFKDYSKDDTVFRERSYSYLPNDNDSIEQTFIKALEQAKQYILPVLDNIVSLRDCIDHYMVYHSPIINIISDEYDRECRNEGLLYFKIDDHSDMIQEFNKSNISYKKRNKNKRNFDSEFKRYCDSGEEYRMELISKRDAIYNDPIIYQQVMEELERRRQANIEKLQAYGLNFNNEN